MGFARKATKDTRSKRNFYLDDEDFLEEEDLELPEIPDVIRRGTPKRVILGKDVFKLTQQLDSLKIPYCSYLLNDLSMTAVEFNAPNAIYNLLLDSNDGISLYSGKLVEKIRE